MKTKRNKTAILLLRIGCIISLLAVIVWCVRFYLKLDEDLYTDDAQVEQYINPVNVRIPGYLKEVRFIDHQKVKKGDTLVLLDDRQYVIQVEQAEAAWLSALAQNKVAYSSVATVNSGVGTDEANVQAVAARVSYAERNFRRMEQLLKDEAATQQQYDQARSEYESLKGQLAALQRQQQTTRLYTQETQQKVDVSQADIKRAQAALDLARLELSYCVITAPYDGFTGRRNIQEGQFVQADQLLLDLVRNDSRWIVANYLETQVTRLRVGEKMSIRVDGIPGRMFMGSIESISEATGSRLSDIPVDNSAGNFIKVRQRIPVRINLLTDPADSTSSRLLRAGMNAQVRLAADN
ncbi:MAG TPA: HlyD family secretion protein [Puia sp.]|jgi:membrane fusion protein (multidrug efflux system)|nr:HlyD family secretion protein [Puia sp.]